MDAGSEMSRMSFSSQPIIPQNIQQAVQRDALHGLTDAPLPVDPAAQAARLEQAIRAHQDATKKPRAADHALWEHLA